jgi:hypothetical protein
MNSILHSLGLATYSGVGVCVIISRRQYISFTDSIFRALNKTAHPLWKSSLVTWKITLFFEENWAGMGNRQWSLFDWQYGNNIQDIWYDLINLDKDEPTGSSEVDEVEIMDNILQQSENVQVDDDDDDDVNIEYISTTSTAQAICNFLGVYPIDSVSDIYLQKCDILENQEVQPKHVLKYQMVRKLEKLKWTSIFSFFLKNKIMIPTFFI